MAYKEVTGMPIWQFENEGDSIEGVYTGTKPGQYGDNLILNTEEGDVMVFGGAVITTKFKEIKVNTKVKITYVGEKKSAQSHNRYKDFKVEVWEE